MTADRPSSFDLDDVVRKVQALLALGTSDNEHEAAAAVNKATELLAKYDLTMESVANLKADPRTAVTKSGPAARATQGKPDSWKSDVLEAVARAFDCRVTYSFEYETTKSGRHRRVKAGQLIGFGHDVEAAGYAQSFLVGEIERLAKVYVRPQWDEIRRRAADEGVSIHEAESWYTQVEGRHPLKAELYFVKGAAQTVGEALLADARRRRDAAARENPNALVLQKDAAVRDWQYQDAYGISYDEFQKRSAERRAKWEEEAQAANAEPKPAPKPETETQRRKREEREARQEKRDNERYWNRYRKEQGKIDHDALRAGQEAGRTLDVRPGVGAGPKTEGELG